MYEPVNTDAAYALPFRRADDGALRLLVVNKLSEPQPLTLEGCASGRGRMLGVGPDDPEPGFTPPKEARCVRSASDVRVVRGMSMWGWRG